MVELVTALEQAHRESPSWRLYGLCHQAATRIAELEAENERTKKWYLDAIEQRDKYARLWDESLSRTGAVKVDRQRLNMEISKWATDSDLHITIGDVEALHEAILSALEPAAPEGQQEIVARPSGKSDDEYRTDYEIGLDDGVALACSAEQAVIDKVLDAAGDYMSMQYGNTALHHPTDRARIKAAMEAGRHD